MALQKRYDGRLQMFVEDVRAVDMSRLRFLRWLAECHELEHPIAGPPSGELAGVQARGTPETCLRSAL